MTEMVYQQEKAACLREGVETILSNPQHGRSEMPKRGLIGDSARWGEQYGASAVRLLVVGRAVGAIAGARERLLIDENGHRVPTGPDMVLRQAAADTLGWIGKKAVDKPHQQIIARKPFFSLAGRVYRRLLDVPLLPEEWYTHIARTNLYHITASSGGNPNAARRRAQLPAMCKSLQYELDFLRPTHVLVITGEDWVQPFSPVLRAYAGLCAVVRRPERATPERKAEIAAAVRQAFGIDGVY